MKTYSVTDLQLIPELSHLRMIDFINPVHTALISPFLRVLGYDLDFPITFVPSQHRNMQGKVVIAYMVVGDVECNASFLGSVWATTEDRVVAAGYKDLGAAETIASAMTQSREYDSGAVEGFPPDMSNPDEASITMQIKVLADLLLAVRGNPFKNDGSRRTLDEQHLVEAPEKRRAKSVKVAK